jgi:hypothetical protein
MESNRCPSSSIRGRQKSTTVISFSSSGGMQAVCETRTSVLGLDLRWRANSLILRTTAWSRITGWRSLKRKMMGSTWRSTSSSATRGSVVEALKVLLPAVGDSPGACSPRTIDQQTSLLPRLRATSARQSSTRSSSQETRNNTG